MKWLSFLSKLAFICNCCFAFCFLIKYSNLELDEELNSLFIILGWVMALVINVFYFLVSFVALGRKRYNKDSVPVWLVTANLIFLVAEVIYFVFNPDIL
jgi:predicted membrane channel-forming protein YqfA (hemolysin III family)